MQGKITRAISLSILPYNGGHIYLPILGNNFHVIEGIKSSVSTLLLTLGIGKNNARRAWALPFPLLGSIAMFKWTLRVLFQLYHILFWYYKSGCIMSLHSQDYQNDLFYDIFILLAYCHFGHFQRTKQISKY